MVEYLDTYDEQRNFLGKETRDFVHQNAIWHKTVHCWLYDKLGNIYFQIRHDSGTFYTTASGHVLAGEFGFQAIIREAREELGIDLNKNDITFIGSSISTNFKGDIANRHFNEIYIANKDINETSLILQEDEVSEVKWIDRNEIIQKIKNNYDSITTKESCWEYLIKYYEWLDNKK